MAIFAAVAIGVVFAVLNSQAASSKNKALRRRARELQVRLNTRISDVQVEAMDAVRRRSVIGTMAIGQASTRFGFHGTGLSIAERLASLAASMTLDTEAVRFAEDTRIAALEAEKVDVARLAQSQLKNTTTAAIEGFASGFGMGLSLESALSQLSYSQTQSQNFSQLSNTLGQVSEVSMLSFPRTFQSFNSQLGRTRLDTDLKLNLSQGIESFLGSSRYR